MSLNSICDNKCEQLIMDVKDELEDLNEQKLDIVDKVYFPNSCSVCNRQQLLYQKNEIGSSDKSVLCDCGTTQNKVEEVNIKVEEIEIKEEPFNIEGGFTGDLDDKISVLLPKTDITLYCEECNTEYEGYCPTCPMLVQIFHNALETSNCILTESILKYILEMKEKPDSYGIFAVKSIPGDVIFGPFKGLLIEQNLSECAWKVKNRKFVSDESMICNNWMQYINFVEDCSSSNLNIFQYKNQLYYCSYREITAGEELLVWFDKDNIKANQDVEVYYSPRVEMEYEEVYACMFCHLGFSKDVHLLKHKTICPHNIFGDTLGVVVQCPVCQIYLMESEHLKHHMPICCVKTERQCVRQAALLQNENRLTESLEFCQVDLAESISQEDGFCLDECSLETKRKCKLPKHLNSHNVERVPDMVNYVGISPDAPLTTSMKRKYTVRSKNQSSSDFKKHEDVKPNKCEIYNKRHSKKADLKVHIVDKHTSQTEKKFKCTVCSYQANYRGDLNKHMYTHTDIKPFECTICKKGFIRRKSLEIHIRDKHTDKKEKKFKCSVCQYQTNDKSNFEKHLYTHKDVKPFHCKTCNKGFVEKIQLKQHIKNKHTGDNEKEFKCAICPYQTNYKGNLQTHLYKHRDAKPLQCQFCGKGFILKRTFKIHVKNSHSDEAEKQFKCSICSYQTNYKNNLVRHIYTHEDVKPFECQICNQGFVQKPHFKKHIRDKHTGEKEKEFKCTLCTFQTNEEIIFRQHICSIHSNIPNNKIAL